MKLGIMQPYFLPYIGYWQLLNAVDKYVIYDDVNFIKGGWINRNRILVNGQPKYFNVPMIGASSFKLINEVEVNQNSRLIQNNLRILESAYKKAPYYSQICPLMERILNNKSINLAKYVTESIRVICEYLSIKTELVMSSELDKDCSLRGQEKVLSICRLLKADEYYNAAGGQALYSFEAFKKQGINLKFLQTKFTPYEQLGGQFQQGLSIIDVLMFNSKERIYELLNQFSLIESPNDD